MASEVLRARDADVLYERCGMCGGSWLDAGELNIMVSPSSVGVERFSTELRPDVSERPRPCPQCGRVMLDKVYFLDSSRIVLDRCIECGGFWLDGGELDAIKEDLRGILPRQVGRGDRQPGSDVGLPAWYFEFLVALAQHRR
jgi:Zn-finger nucleic acid-binding protein